MKVNDETQKNISKTSWLIFIAILLIAIVISLAFNAYTKNAGLMRIYFLDVGQGDAIFIQAPNGNQILIDGGPGSQVLHELGEVMPFFDRSIDVLILTHADADHLSGLIDVLDRFNVDQIVESGALCQKPLCQQWSESIANEKAVHLFASAGSTMYIDEDTYLSFLYPVEDVQGKGVDDPNNASVVTRLVHKGQSVLLTGDVENKGELRMQFLVENLESDFLKLAHHGSKTSTRQEFLTAVSPIAAFIQVGGDNSYGHPHEDVVGRLDKMAIPYYRTDIHGRIELQLDGMNYKIITEKMANNLKNERTLILAKPDALARGLVGEIIRRFERRGFKLVAMKMIKASEEHVKQHYLSTEEQLGGMGNKTIENYEKNGRDVKADFGTDDPLKIGEVINSWNVDFITSGPTIAVVFQGLHAVEMGRKMVGHTFPSYADMGTIRGDFAMDSPMLANDRKKSVKNLVHASGDIENANREIKHWFKDDEVHSYKRVDEELLFD